MSVTDDTLEISASLFTTERVNFSMFPTDTETTSEISPEGAPRLESVFRFEIDQPFDYTLTAEGGGGSFGTASAFLLPLPETTTPISRFSDFSSLVNYSYVGADGGGQRRATRAYGIDVGAFDDPAPTDEQIDAVEGLDALTFAHDTGVLSVEGTLPALSLIHI